MVTKRDLDSVEFMTKEEFSELLENVFGFGGQSIFAKISGISRSQINRYCGGFSPIPKYVVLLLNCCAELKNIGITIPEPQPIKDDRGKGGKRSKPRRQVEAAAF